MEESSATAQKKNESKIPAFTHWFLDECPSEEERSPNGGEVAMADIRAFFMG